jgi:hypothetical protein
MATVYGVNATKNNAPNHQNIIDPSEQGGRIRWIHDSYEATGTEVSGTDIILGGVIPAGAQIVPGASYVACDDLGTGNAKVGLTEDGAELAAAFDVGSAATITALAATADLFGTKSSSKANVHFTPLMTATGTIRLSLMYVMA